MCLSRIPVKSKVEEALRVWLAGACVIPVRSFACQGKIREMVGNAVRQRASLPSAFEALGNVFSFRVSSLFEVASANCMSFFPNVVCSK